MWLPCLTLFIFFMSMNNDAFCMYPQTWNPVSPQQRHGSSIVEVYRIVDEVITICFLVDCRMYLFLLVWFKISDALEVHDLSIVWSWMNKVSFCVCILLTNFILKLNLGLSLASLMTLVVSQEPFICTWYMLGKVPVLNLWVLCGSCGYLI